MNRKKAEYLEIVTRDATPLAFKVLQNEFNRQKLGVKKGTKHGECQMVKKK